MKPSLLTSRQLAEALGVSESSVKRWADEGQLRAHRTAGGHRRISRREAVRFLRSSGSALVRPEILGLDDVALVQRATPGADEAGDLQQALLDGEAALARGLVQAAYLAGGGVAAMVDGPLRAALERIGERWQHGAEGIFEEHRALDIALQALLQLVPLLPEPATDAPVAVGGAPGGDPYLLPSLAVSLVLTEAGYRANNLGPNAPPKSLLAAVERLDPRLVWLSVSGTPESVGRQIAELASGLPASCVLTLGGRHAAEIDAPRGVRIFRGATLTELDAFARGLLVGAGEPTSA